MKKYIIYTFLVFFYLIKPSVSAELKFSMTCGIYDMGSSTDLIIDTNTNKITYFYSYSLFDLGVAGKYKIDPEQTIIKDRFISIIGIDSTKNEYVYVWYDFKNLKMYVDKDNGEEQIYQDCEKKLQL
ncbi:hypothetical protein OAO20_04555 [Candidatus Pelagibacter ubique]|nr:hypothetical protein [Candidatus Pelagibacter ubique]